MNIKSERPGKYIEVSLVVPDSVNEIVSNYIIENLATGLILEDEEGTDFIGVKFYLPDNFDSEYKNKLLDFLNSIDSNLDFSDSCIKTKDVPDVEWVKVFKDSVQPVFIDNVVIRPSWITIPNKDYIDLIIEPKMAFGTGKHETTRLCIKAILKHLKEGKSFFDLGCGNGILSMLSSKKNAKRIKGSDTDPIAVDDARENIVINNVADKIEYQVGSIEIAQQEKPYDFFVANIIKKTILELYNRIDSCTETGGIIVLSGLLLEDKEAIIAKLKENNRENYEITYDGNWIAFTVFK